MNPHLNQLHPYPFEKLATLKSGVTPAEKYPSILLSVGEPQHPPPELALTALTDNLAGVSKYPSTRGSESLRESIAQWLNARFKLGENGIDSRKNVLPVNGTREALFAFAQCMLDRNSQKNMVLMPNPFYQIYEGATILAGLNPHFYSTAESTDYQPDFESLDESVWEKCQLIYICSPGNPTSAVIGEADLMALIERAHKYNFIIASDECYSEIYRDEAKPPAGLLQACKTLGNDDFSQCVVFHSLSKRSNLPGMRSGFVAGDATIIDAFFRYRTYHGCSMSPVVQAASEVVWQDESHVRENRQLYREKFSAVTEILAETLNVKQPEAGFYLWPKLPVDDEVFAKALYEKYNVTVLPGRYLARPDNGIDPGQHHVRIALVATLADCISGAECIRDTLNSL